MLIKPPLTLAIMTAIAFNPALAIENPGAHVHGQASMQVALEGERIDVLFETPAANLVGFEYEPRTETERKAAAEARQFLANTPLINTEAATCRVEQASVTTTHDVGKHDKHDDNHGHDDHHEDHKEGGQEEHEAEEADSHSEFEVSQQLICNGAPGGDLFTPLLTRYPSITDLSIAWVTENNQGSTRLEAGHTQFRLNR